MARKKEPWGKLVLVEFDDGIAWVMLNRPEKRNAMSPALNEEMRAYRRGARHRRPLLRVRALRAPATRLRPAWISRSTSARPTASPTRDPQRAPHGRGMAVAAPARLPEGDDRDGERLVLRRRVHARWSHATSRSRPTRRRSAVRGELGHPPGRQRDEGDGRDDRLPQGALLRDDGRDVRRQASRRDGARERVRAAQEARGAHAQARANAARARIRRCCAASRSR